MSRPLLLLFAAICLSLPVAASTTAKASFTSFGAAYSEGVIAGGGPLTFTVTNTLDSGPGSLRQAMLNANANSPFSDTIIFDASFSVPRTITLTSGEIAISDGINITGPGANLLTISGNNTSRIFNSFNQTIVLSGVTLTGGNVAGNGGAMIAFNGAVTLNSVHVTGNTATGGGGGVDFEFGTFQILNSTFSANNSGSDGGGFYSLNSALLVANSTISGNTAAGLAGGFALNGGTNTLRSVTVTGNTASNGGGFFINGTLDIGSTIVAGNPSPGNDDIVYFSGTVTTAYNIVGNNEGSALQFPAGNPNVNQDIVGTPGSPIDPQLNPLGDNGGTTPTHAFSMFSSPAIDQGNSFGFTTDQRTLPRPFDRTGVPNAVGGDGSDIGAYEAQAPTAALATLSGRVVTADGRGIGKAYVTLSGGVLPTTIRIVTGPFGYYKFDSLVVGETYVVSVGSKRYRFTQPSRVVSLLEDAVAIDFIADP